MKIFILEDNIDLIENIKEFFKIYSIQVDFDFDSNRAIEKIISTNYNAIILDIQLPTISWLEVCKILRQKNITTPILMLTSRNTKKDIVEWLNIWADDYLWKPFDLEELLARINSLVRRNWNNKSTIFEIQWLTIDSIKRKVFKDWIEIELSNLEFNLLKYLLNNKWKAIDRKELLEEVWWDFEDYMFSRTVDIYIWYLRKKLWTNLIKTLKWYWYIIE